jgi:hypothetical protein
MSCVDQNEVMILKYLEKLNIENKKFGCNSSNLKEKRSTLPQFDPNRLIYRIFLNLAKK